MEAAEAMWFLIVFGGVAVFTVVLTLTTVKWRRRADLEGLALRAAQLTAECGDLLLGPSFLWSVWHDTSRVAGMTQLIRDERDRVITTVAHPNVVLDGVLCRFVFEGRQYEIRKMSLMSKRTCLCEAGQDRVLLSAEYEMSRVTYFRGDTATPLFAVPARTVFHRFRPVRVGDTEIGKVIMGLKTYSRVSALSLPEGEYSRLDQLFVLISL